MSEMLNRVAMAIDRTKATIERDIPGFVINEQEASSIALARAAIEAMREPTKAMLDKATREGSGTLGRLAFTWAWHDMIDAALGGEKQPT